MTFNSTTLKMLFHCRCAVRGVKCTIHKLSDGPHHHHHHHHGRLPPLDTVFLPSSLPNTPPWHLTGTCKPVPVQQEASQIRESERRKTGNIQRTFTINNLRICSNIHNVTARNRGELNDDPIKLNFKARYSERVVYETRGVFFLQTLMAKDEFFEKTCSSDGHLILVSYDKDKKLRTHTWFGMLF